MSRFQSVCITGGAGFIGSRLARALLERNLDVTVIDNLSVGRRENVPDGVRLVVADILDSDACDEAVAGAEAVFHLAARVAIRSSFEFAVDDSMTNVSGTASVMRSSKRARTVKRVITASTMGVYSDCASKTPIPETHPVIPVAPYGISKYAAECLTHNMAQEAVVESMALRLFNTYGPGQKLSPYVGVVTIFANKLLAGERATIFGDGEQTRDFVHVDDVVNGFLLAMESGVSGETCNIGSGRGQTVNEVYRAVAKALESPVEAAYNPAVPGELRYSVADIGKARDLLGYAPSRNFAATIGSVVREITAT